MPTRTRILAAARRLSAGGHGRPTLAEVARAAGVSRATVHRVIGSRAELLNAIDVDPDPATRGRALAAAEGVAAVAAYLIVQMQAGRLRLMNPVLALQMFVGPVMVHLLTRRALAEFIGSAPPLEEAVTELAEGWLRALSLEA